MTRVPPGGPRLTDALGRVDDDVPHPGVLRRFDPARAQRRLMLRLGLRVTWVLLVAWGMHAVLSHSAQPDKRSQRAQTPTAAATPIGALTASAADTGARLQAYWKAHTDDLLRRFDQSDHRIARAYREAQLHAAGVEATLNWSSTTPPTTGENR